MISCLSISACRASLDVLERVAFPRDVLPASLRELRAASGARSVAVLSTCQRTEIYANWPANPDQDALLSALVRDKGIPAADLADVAIAYLGDNAARHLLRVATGLESFVLGETEVAGQVRAANAASRLFGGDDVVLHRLLDAAISTARQAHRHAAIAATSRSVASVAIDAALRSLSGTLAGRRVLVVGAGQVASVVVERAVALRAQVTVCNRTRRHFERFAAAGAHLVDLDALPECLRHTDLAVLATAAPHPLVDGNLLQTARRDATSTLTLVDLSLPRNVEPSVRGLPTVRLIDLADLRAAGAAAADTFAHDIAVIEAAIELELTRFRRWLAGRSVADALRTLRADAQDIARVEVARAGADLTPDARATLERIVERVARQFVHGPTQALLAAAEAGDAELVDVLARLFGSATGDGDAARRRRLGLPLDMARLQLGTGQHAPDEGGVHAAHKFAV